MINTSPLSSCSFSILTVIHWMIWQFMCKMSQKALQIFSFASPLFPKSQETLQYYFSSICNFVSSNRSSLRHHVPPLVCKPHTLTACATVPSGLLVYVVIHSKNWIRWIPESADNLEFSAERLSENAKNINFAIC